MESDGKCMHLGSKETSERGGSRSKKMLSGRMEYKQGSRGGRGFSERQLSLSEREERRRLGGAQCGAKGVNGEQRAAMGT